MSAVVESPDGAPLPILNTPHGPAVFYRDELVPLVDFCRRTGALPECMPVLVKAAPHEVAHFASKDGSIARRPVVLWEAEATAGLGYPWIVDGGGYLRRADACQADVGDLIGDPACWVGRAPCGRPGCGSGERPPE